MVESIARDSPVLKVVHGKRRGRKPKVALMKQVEEAYSALHNLDQLQESPLSGLQVVQERKQPQHTMPEAQALRETLIESARQVIRDIEHIPSMGSVEVFLERYLEGKRITEIAKELGVSREWCSRSYRKEAFRLAGMRFVRSVFLSQ